LIPAITDIFLHGDNAKQTKKEGQSVKPFLTEQQCRIPQSDKQQADRKNKRYQAHKVIHLRGGNTFVAVSDRFLIGRCGKKSKKQHRKVITPLIQLHLGIPQTYQIRCDAPHQGNPRHDIERGRNMYCVFSINNTLRFW
jgi:hypothetical protein